MFKKFLGEGLCPPPQDTHDVPGQNTKIMVQLRPTLKYAPPFYTSASLSLLTVNVTNSYQILPLFKNECIKNRWDIKQSYFKAKLALWIFLKFFGTYYSNGSERVKSLNYNIMVRLKRFKIIDIRNVLQMYIYEEEWLLYVLFLRRNGCYMYYIFPEE